MSSSGKKRGASGSAGSTSASKKSMTEKDRTRDFNGWWALDLERSDTMEGYLRKMGMPDIPILAALKMDKEQRTLQRFDITETGVEIRKRTRLNDKTQAHTFGEEEKSESILGVKTQLAVYEKGELIITTHMPKIKGSGRMKLVERRYLEAEGDGHVMRQHMVLTDLSDSSTVDTNRYFTLSKPPAEDEDE